MAASASRARTPYLIAGVLVLVVLALACEAVKFDYSDAQACLALALSLDLASKLSSVAHALRSSSLPGTMTGSA